MSGRGGASKIRRHANAQLSHPFRATQALGSICCFSGRRESWVTYLHSMCGFLTGQSLTPRRPHCNSRFNVSSIQVRYSSADSKTYSKTMFNRQQKKMKGQRSFHLGDSPDPLCKCDTWDSPLDSRQSVRGSVQCSALSISAPNVAKFNETKPPRLVWIIIASVSWAFEAAWCQ